MKEKKKSQGIIKVMQRIYDKNPEMQEVIDTLIIEVCVEEGLSPEHVFFYFTFSLLMSLS